MTPILDKINVMKKIFFAIAALITLSNTANAQDSEYAKDYKVCRTETGYQVCPDQTTTNLNDPAPKYVRRNNPAPWQQNSFVAPVKAGKTVESEPLPTKRGLENSYPQKELLEDQNNRRNLNTGGVKYLSPSTGEVR